MLGDQLTSHYPSALFRQAFLPSKPYKVSVQEQIQN